MEGYYPLRVVIDRRSDKN